MSDAGIYQLLIHLRQPRRLRVGALGEFELAAGWWVYTGSARRGLSHRLARHRAPTKVLRWHIDYLTTVAPVLAVRTWPIGVIAECAAHRELAAQAGVSQPIPGFGSSDCRCPSHLCYLGPQRPADGWPAAAGSAVSDPDATAP